MIFNNSKKLHWLINSYGPGVDGPQGGASDGGNVGGGSGSGPPVGFGASQMASIMGSVPAFEGDPNAAAKYINDFEKNQAIEAQLALLSSLGKKMFKKSAKWGLSKLSLLIDSFNNMKTIKAANDAILANYGEKTGNEILAEVSAAWSALDQDSRPDKLTYMKSVLNDAKIQSALDGTLPQKEADKIMAQVVMGPPPAGGKDLQDYNQQVDTLVQNWNTGSGAWDKAREVGTPKWLKDYLNNSRVSKNNGLNTNTPGGLDTLGKLSLDKDGNLVTADTTGTTSDPSDPMSMWDTYIDKFTAEAEEAIKNDANFKKTEAEGYGTAIDTATNKNNAVLQGLEKNLATGTGAYTPTTVNIGGKDYSYIPKFKKDEGALQALLAANQMTNSINAEDKKYATVSDRSPAKGILQYLALLGATGVRDETLNLGNIELALKKYGIDKDVDIANVKIDANKPGLFDNILSLGKASTGLVDLWGAITGLDKETKYGIF